MAKANAIGGLDDVQLRNMLEGLWDIPYNCNDWFPGDIYQWVKREATVLGVPEAYIAIPLVVATGHLAQHVRVEVDSSHTEPTIIYGLVAGRSGTNKSAALGRIADMVDEIVPNSIFDSGTMDGLAKSLEANKGSVISINDEFSNFMDNLDAGSKRSHEKSRILTLYNGSRWSKKTKTSGCYNIEDPRFAIMGFTQPDYLIEFSRHPPNVRDGFFQRFFVSVPDEVYVTRKQSKEALKSKSSNAIDMVTILKSIYNRCKTPFLLSLSDEADEVYTVFHDEAMKFRQENKFDNCNVSVKSKSKGLSLRLAGIISLLRNAVKMQELPCNQEVEDQVGKFIHFRGEGVSNKIVRIRLPMNSVLVKITVILSF